MTTLHVSLGEWSTLDARLDPTLRGRALSTPEARKLAATLSRESLLDVSELREGLRVRTSSYVGRVQLGDLTVTITPKLGADQLLTLLRYAYGLRDLRRLHHASYATGGFQFADLLVAQLYEEARELIQRGLTKSYRQRSERLQSPRGRVDFRLLATPDALAAATLPCIHHERSSNVLLNGVLRAGLTLGARVTQDPLMRGDALRLAGSLHGVTDEPSLSWNLLQKARRELNRLVSAYEPVLTLVELLYQGTATTLDDGGDLPLAGFLFDMNRFFQALLLKFLQEHLPDHQLDPESAIRSMMRYAPTANPRNRRAPRPRPDFTLRRDGRIVQLLDAKYRNLWDRELPREMLYQLSVYALSRPDGSTAAILYPTPHREARDAIIEILDPHGTSVRGRVALRPVVLGDIVAALAESPPRHAAHAIARRMVGDQS